MATASKLTTRDARKKLAVREDPYYHELRRGLALGYRRGSEGGYWVMREFKADASHKRGGAYVKRRLGIADDEVAADGITVLSWSDAQKLALGGDRPTVTRPGKHTVTDAWEAYCASRKNPVDERELSVWKAFIEPKFGVREVSELTTPELKKWLVDQVGLHGSRGQSTEGADAKDLLRRARYTANRRFNLLRAVLNNSYEDDVVKSADAWRKVRPFQKVDRPLTRFVDIKPARHLLAKIEDPLLGIAAGALYTGLRLSELNNLRVDDIDTAGARVRVRHSKGGDERFVPLNREGLEFFAKRIANKVATDPVFVSMSRMDVSRGMRAACANAGITPRITHRDLRRSYGSLMLNAGAAIEVIQQLLGHADMRMTKRTYSHLLQKTVAKSVQKHLPSFGDETNVTPIRRRRTP